MIRMRLKCYILFLTICAVKGLLHVPTVYTRPAGLQRVNGSDPFGGCPQTPVNCSVIEGGAGVCRCPGGVPTTGVLIDGVIPTIDPVSDMDSWSSEMFTVNRNGQSSIVIGFSFPSPFTLRGVEMKLFSCVAWNIAASTINVYGGLVFPTFNPSFVSIGGSVDIATIQDCSSLSTVTIPVQLTSAAYFIEMTFNGVPSAEWAPSIAEIQFSDETPTEPPTTQQPTTEQTTAEPLTTATEVLTTETTTNSYSQPLNTSCLTPLLEITDFISETTLPLTTEMSQTTSGSLEVTTQQSTAEGSPTSTSTTITVLVFLVIMFGLMTLIFSAALVIVSVRCRVYYKRSTQPTTQPMTTEVEYDDVIRGNSNVPEIELKANEAYSESRQTNNRGGDGEVTYEVVEL